MTLHVSGTQGLATGTINLRTTTGVTQSDITLFTSLNTTDYLTTADIVFIWEWRGTVTMGSGSSVDRHGIMFMPPGDGPTTAPVTVTPGGSGVSTSQEATSGFALAVSTGAIATNATWADLAADGTNFISPYMGRTRFADSGSSTFSAMAPMMGMFAFKVSVGPNVAIKIPYQNRARVLSAITYTSWTISWAAEYITRSFNNP